MRFPILPVFALAALFWASASSAQLVHLTLEAGASFEPSMSGATYTLPKNALLKLDVFYQTNLRRQNPDDTLVEYGGIYQLEAMSGSVLRVRVADLSFYRSLTLIVVRPDRLEFE